MIHSTRTKMTPEQAEQVEILRAQMRFGLPVGVGTPMKIAKPGEALTKLGPPAATAARATDDPTRQTATVNGVKPEQIGSPTSIGTTPSWSAGRAGYVRDPEPAQSKHPADVKHVNRYYEGNLRAMFGPQDVRAPEIMAQREAERRVLSLIGSAPKVVIPAG